MSEAPESTTEGGLHPALKFLQENLLLIGVVALVVVALVVVFLKPGPSAAATPIPSITATAGAATPMPTKSSTSSTATASPAATARPTKTSSAAATTEAPAPTAAATEVPIVGTSPQSVEIKNWRPYAEKFAQAFANTDGGKAAWLARLRPLVTDSLYSGFKETDISRVTSRTFKNVNTLAEENAYSTFVAFYTDGQAIEGLIQVQGDGSWRVHKTAKHEE